MSTLLIIDPQNDFCSPEGALFVPGAVEDCERLVSFIGREKSSIDSIHVTLDSHPYYHIAHPIFWVGDDSVPPQPFTVITYKDFKDGKWRPADEALAAYTENYLLELETRGRYRLTIWPPHCLIATWGGCIPKNLWNALHEWEMHSPGKNIVDYVIKATNSRTEHYSAIHAEVPDPADPATRTNFTLLDKLKHEQNIIVAGEALSHCVANTVRDIAIYIPPAHMTLLTDATSNVAGFENTGEAFLSEFSARGMNLAKTGTFTVSR